MTDSETDGDVTGRRVLAFLVDGIVVTGALSLALRSLTNVKRRQALATVVGSAIFGVPYHILLEGTVGQTVGKRLLGIAVRCENGDPCTLSAATVRTVLRFVDWLPAGYFVGFVSMALSDRQQRVGDRYAETVVVSTDSDDSVHHGRTYWR